MDIARLRREHVPTAIPGEPEDFYLLHSKESMVQRIQETEMVRNLDQIFQANDNPAPLLEGHGLLRPGYTVEQFWLPPVDMALSAPFKFLFVPSGKCAMDCDYCSIKEIRRQSLDYDVAKEVMDQLVELPIFKIVISGGEPTIYPHWFEFAEQALSRGIDVSTVTSGAGLTREWAEHARDLGVRVKVSLDGPGYIQEQTRPGTFGYAARAIQLFNEIGHPAVVYAVHTATNNDPQHINDLVETAFSLGAKGVKLARLRPSGGAMEGGLFIPKEDYGNGKVREAIDAGLNNAHVIDGSITFEPSTHYDPASDTCTDYRVWGLKCKAGTVNMGLNPDGRFDSCPNFPAEYQMSMLDRDSLMHDPHHILRIWQSDPGLKKLRQMVSGIHACGSCTHGKGEYVCPAYVANFGSDPVVAMH